MKSLSVGSLFLLCFLQTQFGFAQNIGINLLGLSPNTASLLDIDAAPNFNKGLLIPRVTFSQRTTGFNPLSAAAQGLTVYQTDAGGFGEGFYFNTSTSTTPAWSFLLNNTSGWALTGNATTTPSNSIIGSAIPAGQNYVGTSDLKDFVLATNNLERLRITANGNVGIGISAPAFTLDVNGGARALLYTFPAPTGDPAPVITARTVPSGQGASAEKTELILFHSNDPANAAGADQITLRAPALSFQTFNDVNVLDMNNNVGYNERMYINSIGNVGIGTISPQSNLHVYQNADVWHTKIGGAVGELRIGGQTSSGAVIQAYTPAGAVRDLYIQRDGGNVGIGTASPQSNLHVYQNADVWHTKIGGAVGELRIGGQTSTGAVIQAYTPAGAVRDLYIQRDGGNVGIGTTAPSAQLHSTGTVRFQTLTGTGNRFVVTDLNGNISAGTATTAGIIAGSGIVNYVPKWTPDGATLANSSIFDNGNVGIGTISPVAKFTVAGDATSGGGTVQTLLVTGNNGAITINSTSAHAYQTFAQGGVAKFEMGIVPTSSDFYLNPNTQVGSNGSAIYILKSTGNVGIGTTSPGAKLDVAGQIRIRNGSGIGFERDLAQSDYSTFVDAYAFPSQGYGAGGAANYWVRLSSKGGTHIVLNTDGGAGSGENSFDHFTVWQGAVDGDKLFNVSNIGNTYIKGNVGIGTTSPGAKLEIAGQIKITGGAPGAGKVLTSDAGGLASWNTPSSGSVTGSGILNYVPKWTPDGNTLGNSSIFDNGNVGIGTVAPSAKLSVASAALGGVYIGNGTFENSAGWNQVFDLHGASHARITARTGAVSMGMYAHDAWNLGTAGYLGTYTNHPLAFIINTTPRMVIDVGGNVGIGTTSPGNYRLNVPYSNGNYAPVEFSGPGTAAWGTSLVVRTTGGTDGAAILFRNRDTKNWQIRGETSGTGFQITEDGGDGSYGSGFGTPRLHISAGGNLGIGTTAPGAKLEVVGQVKITGGVPALGKVLTSDGVGLATWESFTGAGGGGWTDDGTVVRLTTISDNVGIGTTAPGVKLDVVGNTRSGPASMGYWTHLYNPDLVTARLEVTSRDMSGSDPMILRMHQWGSGAAEFYKPQGTTLFLRETPGGGGSWFTKFNVEASSSIGPSSMGYWTHLYNPDLVTARLEVTSRDMSGSDPMILRMHQWGSGAAEFYKPQGTTLFLRETPGGGGSWFTRFRVEGNLDVIGSICYTSGIGACSDIRYKQNITELNNSLANVLKIKGVNYFWRVDEFPQNKFNKEQQIGFIAQDIEKIYPEIVFTDKDGYKSVDYSRLTPVLVEAIKEQNKQNENLQKLVFELKDIVEKTKKQIDVQQKQYEALQKEIVEMKKKEK